MEEEDLLFKKSKIHIRVQALGKKSVTTIEGLDDDLDLKKIAKGIKHDFHCAATVVKLKEKDEDSPDIIKLQGNKAHELTEWLVTNEVLTKDEAKERLIVHAI
jgi:translation initiation factor 1